MTPNFDHSKLAERLGTWGLSTVKKTMLEAIANIAIAVHDKDADRALEIQTDLMWCYGIFDTIKEEERTPYTTS